MEDKHTASEENIQIKVNNQVSNERNLSTSDAINELIFQCLIIVFSAALLFQLIAQLPFSYKLRHFMPTLTFSTFGLITMLLYVLKKKPTLKFYLFLLSFLVGALLGV